MDSVDDVVNSTILSSGTMPPAPEFLKSIGALASKLICDGWSPIVIPYVNECEPTLGMAVVTIIMAPLIWNCLARLEYFTSFLSKVFLGRRSGCLVLGAWIFSFSIYRDAVVHAAIRRQPTLDVLDSPIWHAVGVICGIVGAVFVLSSYYRLGFFGTYLGDYFGILMSERVTGFPFNITDHPMYDGSSLLFTAMAIM